MTPVERLLAALEAHGCNPRRSGNGWLARCPTHDDRNPSLSIREGKDGRALVKCHADCERDKVLGALGLSDLDLFPTEPIRVENVQRRPISATYPYHDESGEVIYETIRYRPKGFAQRRPDGNGGWLYNLNGVRRVLYRLPQVVKGVQTDRWIVIVEGEKDADLLASLGFVATTSPMGACNWRDEYSDHLKDAKVAILPDNDSRGREHAERVARSVSRKAEKVVVLELEGLPDNGDVSDWLDHQRHSAQELKALIRSAEPWEPAPERASDKGSMDEASGPRLLSRWASDITPTRPEWLWRYWIVRGVVQLLAGKQGLGKSTFAAWLVAART